MMEEEKPPFLNEWKNIYAFIAVVLAIIIILLYFFTKYFE